LFISCDLMFFSAVVEELDNNSYYVTYSV
jgi:hypothetical protein